MQCLPFGVWVMSLNIIFSWSNGHLLETFLISFSWHATKYYPIMQMYCTFVIYSSVEGYLVDFHFLSIVNRAAMNIAYISRVAGQVFWAYVEQ